MTERNVIFVGGPGSGKSNYLFRIWLALEREGGVLSKDGMPDDLVYVDEGSAHLLEGRFAPHTSVDTRHTSKIPIKLGSNQQSVGTLVMPDASGEVWLNLFQKRAWPRIWNDMVSEDSGFVLMICDGSDHNVPALDWLTCERFYGKKSQNVPTGIPTQVMLVDWLQILHSVADRKENKKTRPRLSVVVSAWDRVAARHEVYSPTGYLEAEYPLLAHFLASDAHGFDSKVFGLSIFGGDPEANPAFKKQLLEEDPATQGYSVVSTGPDSLKRTDVLAPVSWAFGLES